MIWANLKKNKCPKCDKDWAFDVVETQIGLDTYLKHGCGFFIRRFRYLQILSSQITADIESALEKEDKEINEE